MLSESAGSLVFGPGIDTFLATVFDPTGPYIGLVAPGVGGPHSGYLTFAIGGGLPSLGLFVVALLLSVGEGIRTIVRRRGPGVVFTAALVIAILGWMGIALVDTNPYLFPETVVLFTLLGALSGTNDLRRRLS